MTIDDKIRYEKLKIIWTKRLEQYKVSSGEIDKYEYLTGEEMLHYGMSQIRQQAYMFSFRN